MKILILILISSFILGCGKSPLLNEAPNLESKIQANNNRIFFNSTEQNITANWITNLNTSEEGSVLIIFNKNNLIEDPVGFEFKAKLWMRSMGHGSSPIVINKLAPGIYQLTEIYFTMTGDWQLQLSLSKDGKIIESKELEYSINE